MTAASGNWAATRRTSAAADRSRPVSQSVSQSVSRHPFFVRRARPRRITAPPHYRITALPRRRADAPRQTNARARQASVGTSTIAKLSIFRWETIIESIVRTC